MVQKVTTCIWSYLKCGENDWSYIRFDNEEVKWVHPAMKKTDLQMMSIHYVNDAFTDDKVEPSKNALVSVFQHVDSHYSYTAV